MGRKVCIVHSLHNTSRYNTDLDIKPLCCGFKNVLFTMAFYKSLSYNFLVKISLCNMIMNILPCYLNNMMEINIFLNSSPAVYIIMPHQCFFSFQSILHNELTGWMENSVHQKPSTVFQKGYIWAQKGNDQRHVENNVIEGILKNDIIYFIFLHHRPRKNKKEDYLKIYMSVFTIWNCYLILLYIVNFIIKSTYMCFRYCQAFV